MDDARWSAVDAYIVGAFGAPDDALDAVLTANAAAGLPSIDVSPAQGKMLQLFARMAGARKILEIGTLGGYSTIWLARALPSDGLIVTLEAAPRHAATAADNIRRAGVSGKARLRVGPALETLPRLEEEGAGPFDFVFIDADKQRNFEYFEWALRLTRPGSIIVCDNVVREGAILDQASADPSVQGARRLFERVAREPGVSATVVQTVGAKGWDGFLVAVVNPL